LVIGHTPDSGFDAIIPIQNLSATVRYPFSTTTGYYLKSTDANEKQAVEVLNGLVRGKVHRMSIPVWEGG
jgi:hypothetical protein